MLEIIFYIYILLSPCSYKIYLYHFVGSVLPNGWFGSILNRSKEDRGSYGKFSTGYWPTY
jgi:hypothetical protein